jgi:hypothetical protein
VAAAALFDYRITVEFGNREENHARVTEDRIEEGHVIEVGGRSCLVTTVAPDPQVNPGEPHIIFVHCQAVDQAPG